MCVRVCVYCEWYFLVLFLCANDFLVERICCMCASEFLYFDLVSLEQWGIRFEYNTTTAKTEAVRKKAMTTATPTTKAS